jgi:hypothetical protein
MSGSQRTPETSRWRRLPALTCGACAPQTKAARPAGTVSAPKGIVYADYIEAIARTERDPGQ